MAYNYDKCLKLVPDTDRTPHRYWLVLGTNHTTMDPMGQARKLIVYTPLTTSNNTHPFAPMLHKEYCISTYEIFTVKTDVN